VEVGRDWNGLCHRVTIDTEEKGHDLVIVDRLTKSAHFLAVNQKDFGEKLVNIYVQEIVSKHGVPKTIVSDRGSVFTSAF
jgi:hypothetical protein